MLIQNHSVIENIALGYKDTPFFFPRKVLRQKIKAFSSQFDFQIDLDQKVWQLSAGNIQKLILGREISEQPKLLVASHPTYGLDVGATQFLREHLLKLCRQGSSVLLFSEDLDEIFELCDRVAVIFAGEFMGILETDDERINDIGLMMAESKRIE
jgi:simple sugar transport system ATP-binding protein